MQQTRFAGVPKGLLPRLRWHWRELELVAQLKVYDTPSQRRAVRKGYMASLQELLQRYPLAPDDPMCAQGAHFTGMHPDHGYVCLVCGRSGKEISERGRHSAPFVDPREPS